MRAVLSTALVTFGFLRVGTHQQLLVQNVFCMDLVRTTLCTSFSLNICPTTGWIRHELPWSWVVATRFLMARNPIFFASLLNLYMTLIMKAFRTIKNKFNPFYACAEEEHLQLVSGLKKPCIKKLRHSFFDSRLRNYATWF